MKEALIGLGVLAIVFAVLQRLFPERPEQPFWRKDSTTDLAWFALTATLTKAISGVAIVLGVLLVTVTVPRPAEPWLGTQPAGLQAIGLLVVGDFLGYWVHRLHHRSPFLWRVHAVHHSSAQLDWLSSVRLHPLNDLVSKVGRVVPLYWIGFSSDALAAYLPILLFHAFLLHANVSWRFGWLGFVVSSPAWHRWHHALDAIGEGRNFAGLLPLWDHLFRTAHFPKQAPPAYGLKDDDVGGTVWQQLRYPFQART